jgi:aryl-alcohol dehydrogenase-like predicted oxidoreductase
MATTSTSPTRLDPAARRTFGRTGLRVSPLGFGGAPIGSLDTELPVVSEILNLLLDHGVNLVDTAHAYYGSEDAIGAAVAHRRDEYVLVSKCGSKWEEDGFPPAWTPAYVHATIDRSLRRLRTDRIDVMLLHSCDLETLRRGEVLEAVLQARAAGKVRFAGYSGDNEAAAWAAAQPQIAVVQTSVSICDQVNIDKVLPVAARHQVGIMAKRPIANAAWKALEAQYERYRKYAAPYHERFARLACGSPPCARRAAPTWIGPRSPCASRSASPACTRPSWAPPAPPTPAPTWRRRPAGRFRRRRLT